MAWTMLVLAGLLEVVWAFSMKASHGFTKPWPSFVTVVAMLASFGLLSLALRTLPLGTAYTLWTGIGALGAFVLGVIAHGEPINPVRLTAALLILAGITLMKSASDVNS